MAIIVENMNMPSTCTMCWISNICQEHIHDLKHIGYDKRLDDCPLYELVRCKDCYWGKEVSGNIECNEDLNYPKYHEYDWYCPNGERREE